MIIGDRDLSARTYVIAEIGGNHNGDPQTAFRLVEEAARAKADAVKFQTYTAETLVHPSVEPVPLVKKHYATQLQRFKSLELPWEVYERLFELCRARNIHFMTTCFDLELLERMAPYMPAIKIASGDLTWPALLRAAAATGKPVILSTGMSDADEIRRAAALIPKQQLALLQCTSVYPCPPEAANLRAIPSLAALGVSAAVGYSDHTQGIDAVVASVALGARVVEKHFTLDKSQVPGDHVLSADPSDLAQMVERIRRIEPMLGTGHLGLVPGEEGMREKMRRGVYAARDMAAGETLAGADLAIIRPVTAIPPGNGEQLVGRRLSRPLTKGQALTLGDLEALS